MRYSHVTRKVNTLVINGVDNPAIFMPIEGSDNQYLISSNNTAFLIGWDGHSKRVVKGREVFRVPSTSLVDQANVGPDGKLYVGNFGPNYCADPRKWSLYGHTNQGLVEYNNEFVSTVGGVVIKETQTYYHLDACNKTLSSFKWDPITGALCKFRHSFYNCLHRNYCHILL